jgi:protein gp37
MTKIEWTQRAGTKGETWNPIRARNKTTGGVGHFCTKVSAGCQNCYAADFQKRFKNAVRYAAQDADQVELFLDEKALLKPLHWKKPRTIFVCSMTDLFYEGHKDQCIAKIFAIMALCPQHTFQVLTKRPTRMLTCTQPPAEEIAAEIAAMMADADNAYDQLLTTATPLKNLWLGVSVENQQTANDRIPALINTDATVRFISAEPLLGQIDLTKIQVGDFSGLNSLAGTYWNDLAEMKGTIPAIDWVICGGESGHSARPMHPDWARNLRDQCKAAGTSFFFKQWGAWQTIYDRDKDDIDWRACPTPQNSNERYVNLEGGHGFHGERVVFAKRKTKKASGRMLDGREHNEWPEVVS